MILSCLSAGHTAPPTFRHPLLRQCKTLVSPNDGSVRRVSSKRRRSVASERIRICLGEPTTKLNVTIREDDMGTHDIINIRRFENPLEVDPASGLPVSLQTVQQSITAIAGLSHSIRDREHWRFALSMLTFVSASRIDADTEMARSALASALTAEGWLSGPVIISKSSS